MDPVRAALAEIMHATLADEAAHRDWTYAEVRPLPMPGRKWSPGTAVHADCSKGVQYLCWWTPGAPDPMQNGWSTIGNSQTIWLALHHVAQPNQLEIGDPVTFGLDGDQHAAIVLEPGPDPLLWSHGHQGAPNTYRLSQDGRPYQLCKLPIVKPPTTPQDHLREMTGFYSWVAWRQGEGPWRPYGARNIHVRPNVPHTVPAEWWPRIATFLANRHKPTPPSPPRS